MEPRPTSRRRALTFLALSATGCSSYSATTIVGYNDAGSDTGGTSSAAGASASAGASVGGNSSGGTATSSATGGVANTGGASATGGVSGATTVLSAGGATATGGMAPTGGTMNTGGVVTSGGSNPSGGAAPTGGKTNTGGSTAPTGGNSTTGGAVGPGGTTSTGGAAGSGGVTGVGGTSGTTGGTCSVSKVTMYQDSDGDGYGNPAQPALVCPGTAGYVSNADDCDDSNSAFKPGVSICSTVTQSKACVSGGGGVASDAGISSAKMPWSARSGQPAAGGYPRTLSLP